MATEVFAEEKSNLFALITSFARRACFWTIVYSIGFYKINPIWLLVPLSINGYDKYKRLTHHNQKRSSISTNVNSVPKWVFFPDTDRVEWVNKIISQIWPNLQNHITDKLQLLLEQNAKTNSFFSKLSLTDSSIGKVPLQIGGIKVFKHNDLLRKEVVMDLEVTLATDCNICVKYLPFIYVSVKDLYLYGTLRVTLKPLLDDLPIVGGIDATFLTVPLLDFDLGGIANVVDIPGLSRIVRNYIGEQISSFAVLPNSIFIPLTYEETQTKSQSYKFEEVDLVRITVRGARNLVGKDIKLLRQNTSDPYVKIQYGSFERQSDVALKTLDPQWNLEAEFLTENKEKLIIEVWDWNKMTGDDFLGRKCLSEENLSKMSGTTAWIALEEVKSGEIALDIQKLKLVSDISAFSSARNERKTLGSSAVLLIFLDSVCNLERNKKGRAPSPVVSFGISGRSPRTSSEAHFTQNPVYEEEVRLLVPNPECDDLIVRVMDVKSNCGLGYVKICLSEVLYSSDLELKCQPFKLHQSGTNALIVMGIKLMFPKL